MAYERLSEEGFDSPSSDAFANAFKAAVAEGSRYSQDCRSDPVTAAAVRAGAASLARFKNIVKELTSSGEV